MSLLISANRSFAIDPSGPGLPTRAPAAARMLVSRSVSASIQSCISRSFSAGSRSAGSFQIRTASAIAPAPRLGPPEPPPTRRSSRARS